MRKRWGCARSRSKSKPNAKSLKPISVAKEGVRSEAILRGPVKMQAIRGPYLYGCWLPFVQLRKGNRRLNFPVTVTFPLHANGLENDILKIPGTPVRPVVVRGSFLLRVPAKGLPKPGVPTCDVLSGRHKNTYTRGNRKHAPKKKAVLSREKRVFVC